MGSCIRCAMGSYLLSTNCLLHLKIHHASLSIPRDLLCHQRPRNRKIPELSTWRYEQHPELALRQYSFTSPSGPCAITCERFIGRSQSPHSHRWLRYHPWSEPPLYEVLESFLMQKYRVCTHKGSTTSHQSRKGCM